MIRSLLVFLLLGLSGPAWASATHELAGIKGRIRQLQKDLDATQGSRQQAQTQLQHIERDMARTNRRLRTLEDQQRTLQTELGQLHRNAAETEAHRQGRQQSLDQLLVTYQSLTVGDPLPASGFNSPDPRFDADVATLADSQAEAIHHFDDQLEGLAQATRDREHKQLELQRVEADLARQHQRLEADEADRTRLVAQLSNRLTAQRQDLEALRRDEKRLTRLVENLARQLARRRPPRSTRHHHPGGGTANAPESPPPMAIEQVPELGYGGGDFVRLRGHLRLPLSGELVNRFGSPRSDTGLSWRGLFIRAPQGREIRAVGDGRVVYADWLRGFGNLLIIDHGEGYMSLYGGVGQIGATLGDLVKAGQAVASAGNSGGNPESGLYFELRYQSKPFDPLSWVGHP